MVYPTSTQNDTLKIIEVKAEYFDYIVGTEYASESGRKIQLFLHVYSMNKVTQYWISCALLTCCTLVISARLVITANEMLNGSRDVSNSHPFDQRPYVTQWKRVDPPHTSDRSPQAVEAQKFIDRFERNELLLLSIAHPIIMIQFPHPPFRPRDPACA